MEPGVSLLVRRPFWLPIAIAAFRAAVRRSSPPLTTDYRISRLSPIPVNSPGSLTFSPVRPKLSVPYGLSRVWS